MSFYRYQANSPATISLPTVATQATGSTIVVVAAGRGSRFAMALPTDNKGNTAQQLDTAHAYTRWQDSGTAVYAFTNITGGSDHVVTTTTPPHDETTFAGVEVTGGTRIQQVEWNEPLQAPLTSTAVTTTGPATLVAFWWGDAGVPNNKTAVPNNGFVVVESILVEGELVQCAVAVKNVAAAGTYDVTWTSTPAQGAQLWLVAVQ